MTTMDTKSSNIRHIRRKRNAKEKTALAKIYGEANSFSTISLLRKESGTLRRVVKKRPAFESIN